MKVAILLSGGVDSSVALRLLQAEGFTEITAVYLKIWLEDDFALLGKCPWEEDLRFARAVCDQAGVPLEVLSLQREYFERVVSYALAELEAGRTPSPDIFCNQRIKFGVAVESLGSSFDRIATGHYARVIRDGSLAFLLRGVDPVKDQSYFLSHLGQSQLARCLFPLGGLLKSDVRRFALQFGLPNAGRKDSQGICFLGKIKFNDFVESYLGDKPGEIREVGTERCLGEHRGYWFHTIGQRKGLGLSQGPWYVVHKDVERNIVYVAHQDRMIVHSRDEFGVEVPHWISRPPLREELLVKVRHTPQLVSCRLKRRDGDYRISLGRHDAGLAPGQFAVLYEDEICLGGARIRR